MDTETLPIGGVLPTPDDLISAAANLPITNPSGKWMQYRSGNEDQRDAYLETDNCTGFSYTNAVEDLMNKDIAEGKYGVGAMQFLHDNDYFNEQGLVEFSERALGAMAGTTSQGNDFGHVSAAAESQGLIPNSKWTWDYNKQKTYAEYYQMPPAELLVLAKEFLKHFSLTHQPMGTNESIDDGLQVSPIWAALPVCPDWNTGNVHKCSRTQMDHAIVIEGHDSSGYTIDDHYPPYIKHLSNDYFIPARWKLAVIPKDQFMFKVKKVKINGAYGVLIDSPNATDIVKAIDENEWRSFSKPDSYGIHSVNTDGSTDFTVDVEINF